MIDFGSEMKIRPATEAVKNLKVDRSEFDAAMKKLIATPPLRKANTTSAKRRSAVVRKPSQ